jgi:hypothetical protein
VIDAQNASLMHTVLDRCSRLWAWLLANGASRATVLLVFITAWYAFLTQRMAKAIARQTRAMIQPVALLDFHWKEEKYYPASAFEIKNLGAQPLLVLDVKLSCHLMNENFHLPGRDYTDHQTLWDEHIIPPGDSLSPLFDFKRRFERDKLSWDSNRLGYLLEVVVSDLSKKIVIAYRNFPVLGIVNVKQGMPIAVRWRYFLKPFTQHYHGLLYRFKRREPK